MMPDRYRVGIDTGGTFTDVVAVDVASGRLTATKTASTPDDPSRALGAGLDKVLTLVGAGRSEVEALIHGTTVATNALLEERFSGLALITTAGFRHILEIARQSVPSGYGNSYFWVKPERIVPLERVHEVDERMNHRGEILRRLDDDCVRRVARLLAEQDVEAVAISLIHAYANPEHERRVRGLLLAENPHLTVSISSDVLPEYREYERTMTTCIDAYVKPVMQKYIGRASDTFKTSNDDGSMPFLIMQSNGGVLPAPEVAGRPITTLLSGPAAGALGAAYLAGLSGHGRVLTVDAGGTSTDICLVDGGEPHVTTEGRVGRFPVKVPMVDVTTIGTGGGSIAWIDPSGALRVGPKSAGADPGPMCYGRGGNAATLTDANVMLGRLPAYLLGGEMPLDVRRARQGIDQLAKHLGVGPERLAAGVVEIADWNQVNAVRQVTVKKGLDPRDYTMVAFGGSGPLQAPRVAELLGMTRVLIPPNPGNVSAYGLLAVDLRSDLVTTLVQREDRLDLTTVNAAYDDLIRRAEQELSKAAVPQELRRLLRSADIRYLGEAYEVQVDVPAGVIDEVAVGQMTERFHERHERLYGYEYRGRQVCELVNLRVSAIGLVDRPRLQAADEESPEQPSAESSRAVHFLGTGVVETPVFRRESLAVSARLQGPAVLEEYGSTAVIPPGWQAFPDGLGNLILERPAT
ncbi:MAG TPA: hydantoinase/oxoprolinase family protein [Chloroflexota bacterium]|nr:hydantoinase/oxoprolinase family protein [Chloroflexota bacterium]